MNSCNDKISTTVRWVKVEQVACDWWQTLLNTLRATGVMAAMEEPGQNNTLIPMRQSSQLSQSKMSSARPVSEGRWNELAARDLKLQCKKFSITSSVLKALRNALQS